ncbi:oxidase EvaA [Prauserella shujinwangii]|uniref:Oxidase EvaA n=1 Tax=Prauserella shujinwangii TaxID=1453103 RepID=A0A2T0M3W1_9PSEU|nr:NDP-hexose 2,3-dehydratase family protein [Prauserella shujinwangii]PRX51433.1 oxidase EvaA [Prauserella shujinwangii]
MTRSSPLTDAGTPARIAASVLAADHRTAEGFDEWLAEQRARSVTDVRPVPLDALDGWSREAETGNYRHHSGRFFTIEGLDVHMADGPVRRWSQPIINQPEVGILGFLVKEFDGVLHCLVQAKVEPGNCNGVQLSPTVQATRSNYTGVHRGRTVPYLEFFRDSARHHVLADVRQSEQGARFYQKRNRNMVVETTEEVEVVDGFHWLTLGHLHRLLAIDNLVNMDARTVLSCLPFAGLRLADSFDVAGEDFRAALIRSCSQEAASAHSMAELLSWITERRVETDVYARRIPLRDVERWRYADGRITHETGRYFDVIGVDVAAGTREVSRWMQPMIAPHARGLVAFLVRDIEGVLHVLVRAHAEAGYVDVVELAPTVQCAPDNYAHLPESARPPFLGDVLAAPADRIRFDTELSEEGGRFHHARNRYVVVEADEDDDLEGPGFRWLTLHQVVNLLRHSHYLNIEARSLVACLHSLSAGPS